MSLADSSNVIATSDPTFDQEVYGRSSLVLIDFWAPWCPPCRLLKPQLEKLAVENQSWVTLITVNTDECPIAAGKFDIQSIPAVFALINGSVVDRFQGALSAQSLSDWLQQLQAGWQQGRRDG